MCAVLKIKNENNEFIAVPALQPKDTLPLGTIIEYDGDTIPAGYTLVEEPERQIICIGKAEQTVSTGNTIIEWNKIISSNGSHLSLKNNSIVIGEDISKILISTHLGIGGYEVAQTPLFRIFHNDTQIFQTGISVGAAWDNDVLYCTGLLCDVKEGDLITFKLAGNTNSCYVRPTSFATVERVA